MFSCIVFIPITLVLYLLFILFLSQWLVLLLWLIGSVGQSSSVTDFVVGWFRGSKLSCGLWDFLFLCSDCVCTSNFSEVLDMRSVSNVSRFIRLFVYPEVTLCGEQDVKIQLLTKLWLVFSSVFAVIASIRLQCWYKNSTVLLILLPSSYSVLWSVDPRASQGCEV